MKPAGKAPERPKEATPPRTGLALVWGVVLAFTIYGASEIRDEVGKDDRLTKLAPILKGVGDVTDRIGVSRAKGELDRVRKTLNAPYLVLEEEVVDPIVLVPDSGQAPVEGDLHQAPSPKHRVLIIGASSIQFALGVELEERLPEYQGVKAKRFGQLATGLSRPDFFDWPKKLDELSKKWRPDLVIANFGGNCAQDIPRGDEKIPTGTDAWKVLYAERVKELITVAQKYGADFVYIGMPNMRDPAFAKKMQLVNEVQERASLEAGALFVSTWDMTSTDAGAYRTAIEYKGKRGLIRTSDGVHFKELGARYIVDEVMLAVEGRFVLGDR